MQAEEEPPAGAFLGGSAIPPGPPFEGGNAIIEPRLVGAPPASKGAGAGENNTSRPTDEGAVSGGNCCGPEYIWIKSNTHKSENRVL